MRTPPGRRDLAGGVRMLMTGSGRRLTRLGQQPAGLVLDLDGDLGKRVGVLAVVVGAEQQLAVTRKEDSYVCGSTAAVTQVKGAQRPRRGNRSGHGGASSPVSTDAGSSPALE